MKESECLHLESNKHCQELSSVTDQHAITDDWKAIFDGVFNWYARYVLTASSYNQL